MQPGPEGLWPSTWAAGGKELLSEMVVFNHCKQAFMDEREHGCMDGVLALDSGTGVAKP